MSAEPCPPVSELTTSITRGDDVAFRRFFEEYYPRLYRYLLVTAHGNDGLAREALQSTFLRAARYMKPCADSDQLWRWLTRLARTALIDESRMEQRRQAHHLAAATALATETVLEDDGTTQLAAALDICLTELGPTEREMVEAFYFRGTPQAEIAIRHSLTEKAVELRLARIRHQLRILILKRLNHAQP